MSDGGPPLRARTRTWALRAPLLVVLVALALRLWAPGPVSQTFDERSWAGRSIAFREAVTDADFDGATAAPDGQLATMPGVTTMWSGVLGWYLADAGTKLGVVDENDQGAPVGTAILRASRAVVSVVCVAVLWAIMVMLSLLWGRREALVVGAILAIEPWLVGHSALLHTDAFVTMFGFAGFVALALCGKYLEVRSAWRGPKGCTFADLPVVERWWPRLWAASAGVFFGLALLTKVNAVVVVVASLVALPVAVCTGPVVRGERRAGSLLASWLKMVLLVVGVALVVVVVSWPALWTSPVTQWELLVKSASQVGDPNDVFFAGRSGVAPGGWFYPVAMAFRLSPWLLVGAAAATVVAAWQRVVRGPATPALRGLVGAATFVCGTYLLVIATADKVYDRYALVFIPFLASAVAVVGVRTYDQVRAARPAVAGGLRTAGFALGALFAIYVLTLAPWAMSYASPLVGGQQAAERWIPLGWGEGIERAGQAIIRREGDRCDQATVSVSWFLPDAIPCGRLVGWDWTRGGERPDYAIVYVLATQRGLTPDQVAGLDQYGTKVDEVKIGGVTYAELWSLDGA